MGLQKMSVEMTLGEIANYGANTRGVLLRHQLDFCCRGKRTLARACESAQLDAAQVLDELSQALVEQPEAEDWSERPLDELTRHIVTRYHAPLPGQLDGVIAAASRVERVHGAKESCPIGLTAHLHEIKEELISHMRKEELVLFPAIEAGHRGQPIEPPILVMIAEHESHGDQLERTRQLTDNLVPPPEACTTWRALYEQLAIMERELMEHIHLENHVLFPRTLAG
jgi:regulator of cell morphogenesis and NO signaling